MIRIKSYTRFTLLLLSVCSVGSHAGETLKRNSINKPLTASVSPTKNAEFAVESFDKLSPATQCGTDENQQDWRQIQKQNKADLLDKNSFASQLKRQVSRQKISKMAQVTGDGVDGRYYIPVVFHVYGSRYNCSNGGVCLTEEKIVDALNKTNQDFLGLNTQDGPIAAEFQAIRENLNIEFVLAKTDPDGNPTNGIVRYNREQTGYGDGSKFDTQIAADAWDNFKYMNVYIMHDLYDDGETNRSGVAWYPQLSMSQAGLARVVYNGDYVGTNTNENFRSVLTHEFGHWLNLPHTFDGDVCSIHQQAFCSATGDSVCDTPQMSSSILQDNALNCLGQATNTENFMHYSDNYAMYTQQQVQRMTAALHGVARLSLWSNDNLIATGLEALTSNADHPWDGSGGDSEPQGTLIGEHSNISAQKGEVKNYQTEIPAGTEAVAFYLDGYSEDPDLYVSKGQTPSKTGNDWDADFISFKSPGTPELITISSPSNVESYHTAIDAFTSFSNAKLQILGINDPTLCSGCERIFLLEQSNLSANKGSTPKTFQFEVPADALKTVVVIEGGYEGDPDLYVGINSVPTSDVYDCRPFSAPRHSEFCDLGAGGGTINIMIDPFLDYSEATLRIYYERSVASGLPIAEANGPYTALTGETIAFSSNGSIDNDGSITSYLWEFGDGQTNTQANPQYSYASAGSYNVTLTVTDNQGNTAQDTATATITRVTDNIAPTAVANGPYTGTKDQLVTFSSNGSSDSDGSITSYLWEFGDGQTSSQANPTHSYTATGSYVASLTVTDDGGLSHSDNADVTISGIEYCSATGNTRYEWIAKVAANGVEHSSAAEGYADHTQISLPMQVGQNSISLTAGGTYSEHWVAWIDLNNDGVFDDNSEKLLTDLSGKGTVTGSLIIPTGSAGIQTRMRIIMKYRNAATNSCGDQSDGEVEDYSVSISGSSNIDPVANANGPYSNQVNQPVSFSSTGSQDSDGTISEYLWDFGDGNSSTAPNPEHSYTNPGQYTASLTVTDNLGATHSNSATVTITAPSGELLPDACANQTPITSGRLNAGEAACLGESNTIWLSIADVNAHQTISITSGHGEGNIDVYYKNGGWPSDTDYDAKSDGISNSECISLTAGSQYWSYLKVTGNASGASIIVDFDTPGCRAN